MLHFTKRILLLTALLSAALPTTATALSCMPTSARAHLDSLLGRTEQVTAIAGYIAPRRWGADEGNNLVSPLLDKDARAAQDPEAPQSRAQLTVFGAVMGQDGGAIFGVRDIQIFEYCVLSWCGNAPIGPGPALFFLTSIDGVLTSHVGPCGGGIFDMPSPDQMRELQACLARGLCAAQTGVLDDLLGPPF